MRRRIREAIVGVSAIILLALGIPLAIVVHRWVLDGEVVELQAKAATALAEIEVPLRRAQIMAVAEEADAPSSFAVYGPDGRKLHGQGPSTADAPVEEAMGGKTASSVDEEIVVATPIVEPGTERVLGVLRLSESLADADGRSRTAWLIMGAAGLLALGLAWVIGNRLARILADPLSDLAASARSIGNHAAFEPRPPSGIEEIDALADVLADRSREVHEALQREQQFSADVSHQLRTPVTALRLKIEASKAQGLDDATADEAIADVDRLEATIEHLLAVARDSAPTPDEMDLADAVADALRRWRPRAEAAGRALDASPDPGATVRAHRASVDEVLDVLVDNAIRHGEGAVTVGIRHTPGGVAVDVADEGTGIGLLDAEPIFTRGHGSGDGEGIGLAVARSLAEADGGRLVLTGHRPTTFSLVLLEVAATPAAPPVPGRRPG